MDVLNAFHNFIVTPLLISSVSLLFLVWHYKIEYPKNYSFYSLEWRVSNIMLILYKPLSRYFDGIFRFLGELYFGCMCVLSYQVYMRLNTGPSLKGYVFIIFYMVTGFVMLHITRIIKFPKKAI